MQYFRKTIQNRVWKILETLKVFQSFSKNWDKHHPHITTPITQSSISPKLKSLQRNMAVHVQNMVSSSSPMRHRLVIVLYVMIKRCCSGSKTKILSKLAKALSFENFNI